MKTCTCGADVLHHNWKITFGESQKKRHDTSNLTHNTNFVCLFSFRLYVLVNTFPVTLGHFPVFKQVLSNIDEVSCSRTQHRTPAHPCDHLSVWHSTNCSSALRKHVRAIYSNISRL